MEALSTAARRLLESKSHGVMVVGERVENCNEVACHLLGMARSRLIGESVVALSPAIQADGTVSSERWQRRMHAARAGQPQWFQWQFRKSDASRVHALVHLGAEPGGSCVVAQVHDLSHLSGAGWVQHESESRLKSILEHQKAVIFVKDRDGHYIFANHELERTVRRPAQEIIGHTDRELWQPELAERFRRNDLVVLEQRQAIEFEVTDPYAEKQRTFLSFKFPLFDPDGTPYAVCGIASDISERKRIEDALRSAALAVSSAQGSTVFQELVRYLATTLKLDCAFIAVPGKDNPRTMHVLAFFLDGEIRESFEYPIAGTPCETVVGQAFRVYPSGLRAAFPVDLDFARLGFESYAGFPLSGSDGKPLGLISVMSRKPMSETEFIESILKIFSVRAAAELERLHAEQALRASEASYRAIFEASEDAIFVHEWDTGAVVDVNPKACAAYGYTYEEMLQLSVADMSSGVHPYTAEEAARLVGEAKRGGPLRFEWHRRNKDGSLHWDEVYLRSAVIAGKQRMLAFTREITDRKLAEVALRTSEEQYRGIFNTSVDGLLLRDAKFRVVDVNPAFLAITGYAREEILGVDKVLTMPIGQSDYARALQRRVLAGESASIAGEGVRKDGTSYQCEVHLVPMQYRGEPHVLGILRDITMRKHAEEERARLEVQLRQAQKMEAIGQLTDGIAHDFNNLLTSIMGYVVLATERQAGLSDARLAKYLELAHLSCQRARDLIRQMLTFSRGQRGEPRPLSLPPLVKEAVRLLRSSLPSTVEIDADLGREVPAVLLDPVHVDQVLLNLGINARDAMDGVGSIHVAVDQSSVKNMTCASCRQSFDGDFVELRVEDNGPGIMPEVLDRMFEPFYTTKEVGKGSGMGLSTVHGIVHEHGGHVVVETSPGHGARFRVLFRAMSQTLAEELIPAGGNSGGAVPRSRLQGHVLVIDDEETVCEFMRDMLESWGLHVTAIADPSAARGLVAAAPDRYSIVITDQTMPKITGVELARELLTLRPDLPVILYTGLGDGIVQREVDALGIRALMRKPIEPPTLFDLLEKHLSRSP